MHLHMYTCIVCLFTLLENRITRAQK